MSTSLAVGTTVLATGFASMAFPVSTPIWALTLLNGGFAYYVMQTPNTMWDKQVAMLSLSWQPALLYIAAVFATGNSIATAMKGGLMLAATQFSISKTMELFEGDN
jgi:hypothetical protein